MYPEWSRAETRNEPAPASRPGFNLLAFVAAHAALGLAMNAVSFVAAIHAGLTIALAVWWAVTDVRLERVAWAAAYITGAEVLWRMTNNQLPWELAKYAVTLICVIAAFRTDGRRVAWSFAAFSLLLPSAYLTLQGYDAAEARNQLSFNLSGPLALCACAGFFSLVRLPAAHAQRLLLSFMAPVAGIATITLFHIATNPNLQFSHQSNFALSGGFGPNQVSAALGLGCLAALLFLFEQGTAAFLRLSALGMALWFGLQSALTFSRGGLFSAGGAMVAGMLWRATDPRALVKPVAIGLLVVAIGYAVFWPRLDDFTGGNLGQRFQETDTSLRADLGEADMQLWRENRLLGVGPGLSKLGHLDGIIAHTEFTRLLAEHGMFGLAAMVLMAALAVIKTWRAPTGREKGFAAACAMWAVLFMLNSGMRLVAPAVMFGLTFVSLLPEGGTARVAQRRPAAAAPRWLLVSPR
jgi:hypothetical protein